MSAYALDFQALKGRIRIEDAASFLGLKLAQNGEGLRGPCPNCNRGGDRALIVTPSKASAYCHAEKRGGDVIWLASHVRGIGFRAAAEELDAHFSTPAPQNGAAGRGQPSQSNGDGLANVRSYLQWTHDAVQALGLTANVAEALGIGLAP